MMLYKGNAKTAGILFIIGTLAGVLELTIIGPVLNAPDFFVRITASTNQVLTGGLLQFIMAAACAGIAISLYPVLKKYNTGLALGAVGFRLIEAVFDILAIVILVSMLTLGQQYSSSAAPDALYFHVFGAVLLSAFGWVNNVAVLLAWSIGALLYYIIFYRSKLVPRWISIWGLAGILLTMAGGILVMLSVISPQGTIQMILSLPMLPQEMVLAVWLIVRGFSPPALALLEKS